MSRRLFSFDADFNRMIDTNFIAFAGDTDLIYPSNTKTHDWFDKAVTGRFPNAYEESPNQNNKVLYMGFYVVGPEGTRYAHMEVFRDGMETNHTKDPNQLVTMIHFRETLQEGLRRYRLSPPKPVTITADEIEGAKVPSADPTTSVIRTYTRLVPVQANSFDLYGLGRYKTIGRDWMWIYEDEVKALLDSAQVIDQPVAMPAPIVMRMLRFHMGDNVRGLPTPWKQNQIRAARFRVTLVGQQNQTKSFRFTGTYEIGSDKEGHRGAIEGKFEINTATNHITLFRAYAESRQWGTGEYHDIVMEAGPLAIAMTEAPEDRSEDFPPQGLVWHPHIYVHYDPQTEYRHPDGVRAPSATDTNLLKTPLDLANWRVALGGGAQGKMTVEGNALRFDIDKLPADDWNAQCSQEGMTLDEGQTYLLTFRIKADVSRIARLRANVSGGDSHAVGINQTLNLTTEWRDYSFRFVASRTEPGKIGIPRFIVGQQTGTVWIADIRLIKQ